MCGSGEFALEPFPDELGVDGDGRVPDPSASVNSGRDELPSDKLKKHD